MWDVTSGLLVLSECDFTHGMNRGTSSKYFVMLGGHLREFYSKSAGCLSTVSVLQCGP